jgi:hypothetical protein
MTVAEIDDVLRQSLSRIAPDADPTGVADAIRARVAAGDTGTPASSSGFRVGGIRAWLPFIVLVVVAGLVGGSLGVAGVFGHPTVSIAQAASSTPAPTSVSGATASGSPTPVSSPTPSATAVAPAAPIAPTKPVAPPAPDNTAPTLAVSAANPGEIWGLAGTCATDPEPRPTSTRITTSASDAGGVASTTAVSSFGGTVISPSGPPTARVFTISAHYPGNAMPVTVTITVTATDPSGNATTHSTTFTLDGADYCLD